MLPAAKQSKTYQPYLDYLRVFAAFAVILVHVSAQNIGAVPLLSANWLTLHLYNNAVRWPNWIFLMISGALLLDPQHSFSTAKLYRKNLLRIGTAFFFWSFLYALNEFFPCRDWRAALSAVFAGHYHMWFLFMIAGLYLLAPMFRQISSEQTLRYILLLLFGLRFFLPFSFSLLRILHIPHTIFPLSLMSGLLSQIQSQIPSKEILYFLLGTYLVRFPPRKSLRIGLYASAVFSYLFTIGIILFTQTHPGSMEQPFDFALTDLLMTAAIFLFFKQVISDAPSKAHRFFRLLSASSFGIYLVHPFVIDTLASQAGLTTLSFSPVLSVPVLTLLVFLISLGITMVLRKIPVLKTYVV